MSAVVPFGPVWQHCRALGSDAQQAPHRHARSRRERVEHHPRRFPRRDDVDMRRPLQRADDIRIIERTLNQATRVHSIDGGTHDRREVRP
jgi:hypothetical protein